MTGKKWTTYLQSSFASCIIPGNILIMLITHRPTRREIQNNGKPCQLLGLMLINIAEANDVYNAQNKTELIVQGKFIMMVIVIFIGQLVAKFLSLTSISTFRPTCTPVILNISYSGESIMPWYNWVHINIIIFYLLVIHI
jgi:hypothetical protein